MRATNRGTRGRRAAALAIVLVLGLVACADDDAGTPDGASPWTAPDGTTETVPAPDVDVVPPEVTAATDDWPLPGRDHANSRAVPDSPITTATIDRLAEAWRSPLTGSGVIGNAATTPLVLGDRIVLQTLDSTVRVLDRDTGEVVWEQPSDDGPNIGPNGVAVGWGRVYATTGMRAIVALDLETGEALWTSELVDTPTGGIDIQPQVAAGLVLVSTVPISLDGQYTGGDRGVLHALDAGTGDVVWTFDTVDSDDLWGDPDVNSGGGAWYTPAVDADEGIVYWGIANPAPFPGTAEHPNGSSRPGPNLYTNSVVALDVRTGELLWYRQVIEHDIFDRDHVHTMLVDTPDGPVLVSTGKSGLVVGHDVDTGEILWQTPVGIHVNSELTELEGPTEVWPGTYGGVLTPPAWADGVVYVATLNAPTDLSPDVPSYIGSRLGTAPGEVAAVDATSGALLWSTPVDGDPLGGATVVGDLVLTATYDGRIHALARATGEIVWSFDAPGGINGWPAVAGDLVVWPIGLAEPATLLALRLDG